MKTSHFTRYYRRVIETLRYGGPYILLWRMLVKCLSPLGSLKLVTFYQKDLSQPLMKTRAKVNLIINQANESDIEHLVTLVAQRDGLNVHNNRDHLRKKILNRIQRGSKCFVAKIGTKIVHYNWFSLHRVESVYNTGLFMNLRDDEVYCEDAYTAQEWRGYAINPEVSNHVLLFLKKAGYRKAYMVVETDNIAAKKNFVRIGWEFSGTMIYFIPQGGKKLWIRRIKGTLEPFVERRAFSHGA